jgi:hypothetical protein
MEVHAAVQRLATTLAHETADGPGGHAPGQMAAGQ